ncbi:type IV pilus twitching motility protein PilT [Sandaracinus amylolyticus]|uniref:type IV pilus twitching motility protein PilT n=1 Tax=Sandaracinus amylolyticus TaxID=927083 RepID=UPI001F1C6F89|nr:type IV pilus twitching motility protein PilT [Sandaracinus amylolyticus]UJR79578.1 Type IV pilus twitching motility protein PilT [Sandaracinus amylolyticus]
MLRLDFYVQHLVRHNAREVMLASGEPVRFRFAEGDRASNTAIEHAQVVQLVQEAAPPTSIDELRRTRKTSFQHAAIGGILVRVEVDAAQAAEWRVVVRPENDGGAIEIEEVTRPGRPNAERVERITAERPAVERTTVERTTVERTTVEKPTIAQSPAARIGGARPAAAEPKSDPKSGEIRIEPGHAKNAMGAAGKRVDAVPGEPKINHYLRMMVACGASDLHLSSDVVPMVRRHGEMTPLFDRAPIPDREMRELLIEIAPARNKEEFGAKNDTDFAHTIEEVARFRANYFMDRKGMGAVFRQIPFDILPPEKLGLPPKVLELCHLSKGLVLVTGPTGSGKSTTLATLIDVINSTRSDHIITIEDPIEFVHPNKMCLVNQREVGVHTAGFKNALRAALREDPDIVLVGELRDLETISIAIETAETGHLVFGTLHTTSAPSTVDRIIDQFPADRQAQIRTMLSESLRGVIAQMLCKKKGGGRVAAYEVMIANPAVSNLIREGKTFQLKSVMQTGRNLGMQTMNDHLIELVKADKVEPLEAYMKSNDKQVIKDLLAKAGFKLDLGGVQEH